MARRSAVRTYYKADLQAQYYYSFARGFVLGLNFQGGYGNGLDGKPYPIFKNYYAGGIGSVRGYEPSSLGPRDATTGDPIGGSKLLVGNIELTFPLPGTGYDRTLRVFTFLDGGNVWGTEGNSVGRERLALRLRCGSRVDLADRPAQAELGFPARRSTPATSTRNSSSRSGRRSNLTLGGRHAQAADDASGI